MSGLSELINRLEKASGRDYAIDLELACEFGPFIRKRYVSDGVAKVAFFERAEPLKGQMAFACGEDRPEAEWRFLSTPAYTASMDAALSLMASALPGRTRSVDATVPEMGVDVVLYEPIPDGETFKGTSQSEPIATCIAILRALAAQPTPSEIGWRQRQGGERMSEADMMQWPLYRFLELGEVIQKGDECPHDDLQIWETIPPVFYGLKLTPMLKMVRRRVDVSALLSPDAPASSKEEGNG